MDERELRAPTGTIQISPREVGRLIVLFPYTSDRVTKIKTVAGRRWHQGKKYWTVPHHNSALSHLLALFAGEPVEVEPSLRPVNAPDNRKTSLELVSDHAAATNVKLLDQIREAVRTRHYSYRTEEAYLGWIRRFILFQNKRDPAEIGEAEIARFLSSLARDTHVSASTHNQALNAILFLYREVLGKNIGYVNGIVRAKKPRRLPVVLTQEEVKRVLNGLNGTPWLMAMLLYGAGLRLLECCRLRVKDIDCSQNQILAQLPQLALIVNFLLASRSHKSFAHHMRYVKQPM